MWRRMLGAMSSITTVDVVKLVPAVVAAEPLVRSWHEVGRPKFG